MAKYRIMCVKYGWTEVEAETEEEAVLITEDLPDGAFQWSDRDDHQVTEEIDY